MRLEVDRAPPVEAGTWVATFVGWLRFGAPATPGDDRLRLLPSGPDLVHGSPSPRDRAIIASWRSADPGPAPLGGEFSPARADCGFRAPLTPRLARSAWDRTRAATAACGGMTGARHRSAGALPVTRQNRGHGEAVFVHERALVESVVVHFTIDVISFANTCLATFGYVLSFVIRHARCCAGIRRCCSSIE